MRFHIVILKAAQREYESLSQVQRNGVDADFKTIEERGIEFVKRRYLRDGLFEIKSGEVRSLFQYREGQIVLVGLIYTKKTQKTPEQLIKLAQRRLKEEA